MILIGNALKAQISLGQDCSQFTESPVPAIRVRHVAGVPPGAGALASATRRVRRASSTAMAAWVEMGLK